MKLLLASILTLFTAHVLWAQDCAMTFSRVDSLPTGSIWFTAHVTGTNPVFTWADGTPGPTIEITEPGVYVAFVTTDEGCNFGSGLGFECETHIRQEGNSLKAYKLLGGSPLSFQWSTGETTQTIYPGQSGIYSVTVTGSTDCSGGFNMYNNSRWIYYAHQNNNCATSINYNNDNTLTAVSSGVAPITYQWSPGNYTTQTIDPGVPGEYCVTTVDAQGCIGYACRNVYDPAQCDVHVYFTPDSTVGGYLFAEPPGYWPDFQYLWSNGSTNSYVPANTAGEYCVTLTNTATGCTSSTCYWYWPDSLCVANIQLDSIGLNSAFLSATGAPFPVVSYQWNNGGSGATNETFTNGWQNVTVTNSEGCTATASFYLYKNESLLANVTFPDSINLGNDGVHALLYLIEYDTTQGGILTAIDTIETHSWTNAWALGEFFDVLPGQYLIKAALLPNSNGYNDHLPTYSNDAIFWTEAIPVTFNAFSTSPWQQASIVMVPGQNPGGPGFIGGLVSEGANAHGGGDPEFTGNGNPLAGIYVVLTLADGTPVACVLTDANGQYNFDNLAWGTYVITLDIPGLPLASNTVTIGPDTPSLTNIDFKVDENSIALPVNEGAFNKVIKIFPNPTEDVLFIETPENAETSLLDALGKTVLTISGTNSKTKISLAHLSAGMYFLSVRTAGTLEIVKIMKQ